MPMKLTRRIVHGPVEGYQFGYSPLPFVPTIPVYCYYIDGLLIDTAQRHRQRDVLQTLSDKPIRHIALTHHHEDHSGNAFALHRQHRVPVYASEETAHRVGAGFSVLPYEEFWFGRIEPCPGILPLPDILETERYQFHSIHTPGHSPDHHVLLEKGEGWLFAGDFYIGNLKIFRRGENFRQHVESTRHMLTYEFDTLFCGHNPVLKNGKTALANKLQYLEDFRGRALELHGRGLSIPDIRRAMRLRENYLLKAFTYNDVGIDVMIDSAVES